MKLLFLLLCVAIMVSPVAAVIDVSIVSSNNGEVVFKATGASGTGRFIWGASDNYYWTTPNQTVVGGEFTDSQLGAPMLTGETYKVKACDDTGCSVPLAWTVPEARMINITNFGAGVRTMWRSGFNITKVMNLIIVPYIAPFSDVFGTSSELSTGIIVGILFLFIFAGYWLRGQGFMLPAIMAIVSGAMIWGAGGIAMQLPDEFKQLAFPLMVIGFAGVVISLISNK